MSSDNAAPAALAYQEVHYAEDQAPSLYVGCITSIVLTALSVTVRLWAQGTIGKALVVDSWLVVIAVVIAIASTAVR